MFINHNETNRFLIFSSAASIIEIRVFAGNSACRRWNRLNTEEIRLHFRNVVADWRFVMNRPENKCERHSECLEEIQKRSEFYVAYLFLSMW